MSAQDGRKTSHSAMSRQARLKAATLAADRAEYRRTTIGERVEQAIILSKELGELAARGLERAPAEDLVKMKEAAGRPEDLLDLQRLREIRSYD
jgi:hypothetical protein